MKSILESILPKWQRVTGQLTTTEMDASDDVIDSDIKNAKQHPNFGKCVSWMELEYGVEPGDFGSDDGDKLEDMVSWICFLFKNGNNKSHVAPTASATMTTMPPLKSGVLTVFQDAKSVGVAQVPQTTVINREVMAKYFDPSTHKASTAAEYQEKFAKCAPPVHVVQRPKPPAAEEVCKQADLRSVFAMSSKGLGAAVPNAPEISQQPSTHPELTLEQSLEKLMDEESLCGKSRGWYQHQWGGTMWWTSFKMDLKILGREQA